MNTLASIVSGEPPINPPPLSIEAQRISRINIELLEDSFITNEKISSLTTQIEQCLAVLVSQSARIHGLKGQLDSSQAECTSLRSRLAEKTKLANAYNRRIRVLEKDLSSVEEVMATLRAKLRDAKARLDALRRCVAILNYRGAARVVCTGQGGSRGYRSKLTTHPSSKLLRANSSTSKGRDEGVQEKAAIGVRGGEIAGLENEIEGMRMELGCEPEQEIEVLKEKLSEIEGKLQCLLSDFVAFGEDQIDTLENEFQVKDAAIAESENRIYDLTTEANHHS
ncbi:hypothetical protein NLI96_g11420 [Meripilus lineatus]|uniref:Uncharacterized protein n=1 Tax=Meripilus lineatus TaxID=2056292 RepID=A0AAD5UU83_9APHY|nr:hypothetical protein NLI96_g11420 [Physisporinus lineatus]